MWRPRKIWQASKKIAYVMLAGTRKSIEIYIEALIDVLEEIEKEK
jgi:hypothetical protein